MARKILVVNDNSHVKKSVALFLIRRVLADWEIEGLSIRRRPLRAFKHACAVSNGHSAAPYIPAQMPPREIPGVYFKPPERKPISLHTAAQCLNAQ